MHDHRHQPDSLPVRTSFGELQRVPTERSLFASRGRALSKSSCAAVSERSFHEDHGSGEHGDCEHGGILLNGPGPNEKERRRSRRPTKSSVHSGHSSDGEVGSTLSFAGGEQTEEDVCFPMIKTEGRTGINFKELDGFTSDGHHYCDQHRRMTYDATRYPGHSEKMMCSHRPLVPVAINEGAMSPVNSLGARAAAAAAGARGNGNCTIFPDSLQNAQNPTMSDSTQVDSSGEEDTTKIDSELDMKGPYASVHHSGFRARSRDDQGNAAPSGQEESAPNLSEEQSPMYLPDRFSFFASESDETVHAPDIPSLVQGGQSFQDLFDQSNGTWWLDCYDPTDLEMKVLSKAFSIHPLTAEDIRTEESREKVELFKSYYFVCFHTFDSDPESESFLEPVNMYVVVFRDGILSFHFSPVQHTVNVRRRIRQLRDYVSVSADWICYALIDDITDSFAPIIRDIEFEADEIEETVFVAQQSDIGPMIRRISEARRKVMSLLRLLSGKADVIKMFAKRCNEQWDNAPKGEIGLYLGDIQDHIVTMHQNLSAYEKIFSRSLGNYLAQLQVEFVTSNNRVTAILGKVTLLGTILLPMNLITGMWGMNVHVPGEGIDNLTGFFTIGGFIIGLAIVLMFYAQRYMDMTGEENNQVSAPEQKVMKVLKSPRRLFSKRQRNSLSSRPSRTGEDAV